MNNFFQVCSDITHYFPFTLLTSIVFRENDESMLTYVLYESEDYEFISISFLFDREAEVPSVSHLWKNAVVFEEEIFDLYGITFNKKYNRQYFGEGSSFPMSKYGEAKLLPNKVLSNFDYEICPHRNVLKNQEQILLDVNQHRVEQCLVRPGLFHLGIEKALEKIGLKEAFTLLDSYFPTSSIQYSQLLSAGIEDFMGIDIPDRAKGIRMILLELNRINNHIQFLLSLAEEIEVQSFYSQMLIYQRKFQAILLSYCGNEFGVGIVRPGGVNKDFSQVWLSKVLEEIRWIEVSLLGLYKNLILKANIRYMLDYKVISKGDAREWGVTGPLARGSGLNLDFRKTRPFYFYEEVEFDVPIGTKGTAFDILLVRIEEIFQSLKIIVQIFDNLRVGKFCSDDIASYRQLKANDTEIVESVYRDTVINTYNFDDLQIQKGLEGPKGLYFMFLDRVKSQNQRFQLINPAGIKKKIFENSVVDKEISEVYPIWMAMNISMKEAER